MKLSSPNVQGKPWVTLAILSSIGLISMHAETMLLPAIPDIISDFHINYSTSAWILTAFLISGAVITPIAGKLSDVYGRKKILLIIMIIYTIGVTLGGLSFSISSLLAARIIQGVGLAMFPIAFGIIKSQFPQQKLAFAQGIFISTFAGGSAVGLAVGGTIVHYFGWHATFFSIIPISIGLIVVVKKIIHASEEEKQGTSEKSNLNFDYCCVFTKLSEEQLISQSKGNDNHVQVQEAASSRRRTSNFIRNLDVKGAITLALTITSFLLALSYLEDINTNNLILIIVFSVTAVISLLLFVVVERRSFKTMTATTADESSSAIMPSPLVNLNLMIDKTILPTIIILMIVSLTMFMVYQSMPILIRSPNPAGFGGDAIATANVQLPFMVISFIVSSVAGIIVSKFGNVNTTLVGNVISTMGFFLLFMFHSSTILLSINLGVIAIGLSLSRVGGFNIVAASTPKQYSGIAYGITVLFFYIGMAMGPTIAGLYLETQQVTVSNAVVTGSFPSPEAYNMIFLTAAVISLASIGLTIILKRK
jgi:MFS family permease